MSFGISANKFRIICFLIVLMAVCTLPALAESTTANETLRSLDIEISLKDDGSATWRVEMAYTAPVYHAEYLVLSDVENLEVTVGGTTAACSIEKRDVGSLLICPDIDGKLIVYSFRTPSVVRHIGTFQNFAYTVRTSEQMDFFALKISLPLGSVLADPDKLEGTGLEPFGPSFGHEGSNGRQILVSWEITSPRVGDVIDASVLYEQLPQGEVPEFVLALVGLAVLAGGFIGWSLYARKRPERLLPALGERERPVMEIIIKNKTVDQSDIVRALGWPKVKVSRATRVLVDRGLIEALPKGRTKEVRLIEQHKTGGGFFKHFLSMKVKQRTTEIGLSRSQAIELIQTTITPMIDWTTRISQRLHVSKFGYAWNESAQDFNLEGWSNPLSSEQKERHMKDVKIISHDVEKLTSDAEKAVVGVERTLERVKNVILENKKFISMCKPQKGIVIKPEELVRHIIDRDKMANDSYTWSRFWNARSNDLLKAAEDSAVKKSRLELAQSATKLNRNMRALKEELESIRDNLRRQYHILYKEYRD